MHVAFQVGQRVLSQTEPELGEGLVVTVATREITVRFLDENRKYRIAQAPLTRSLWEVGRPFLTALGLQKAVELSRETDKIYEYLSEGLWYKECDVQNCNTNNPDAGFKWQALDNPNPQALGLYYWLLKIDQSRGQALWRSLAPARIHLLPHQLAVAHRALSQKQVRLMLADEVGLGKTIEAGLIYLSLESQRKISRVLIIVPEVLIHQWLVEFYRKFHTFFHLSDTPPLESETYQQYWLKSDKHITSLDFLSKNPQLAQAILDVSWDLVILDEAHSWLRPPNTLPEKQQLKQLTQICQHATHCLLLSATPTDWDQSALKNRINCLQIGPSPEFKHHSIPPSQNSKSKDPPDLSKWIICNRRDVLPELPSRKIITPKLEITKKWIQTLQTLFTQSRGEPQPTHPPHPDLSFQLKKLGSQFQGNEDPYTWILGKQESLVKTSLKGPLAGLGFEPSKLYATLLKEDPRLPWLLSFLKLLPENEKAVLFCAGSSLLLKIKAELARLTRIPILAFHEEMDLFARDRGAAQFTTDNSIKLLLCTEMGTEGRNFQAACHVILWDLPPTPALLEQRIGRLHRIGQTREVCIYPLILPFSPFQEIFDWYGKVLNAFTGSCNWHHPIHEEYLNAYLHGPSENVHKLLEVISEHAKKITQKEQEQRDPEMEMRPQDRQVAQELSQTLLSDQSAPELQSFLELFSEIFGLECAYSPESELGHLYPGPGTLVTKVPGLPENGFHYTLSRNKALEREDLMYITWEHPWIHQVKAYFEYELRHRHYVTRWKGAPQNAPYFLFLSSQGSVLFSETGQKLSGWNLFLHQGRFRSIKGPQRQLLRSTENQILEKWKFLQKLFLTETQQNSLEPTTLLVLLLGETLTDSASK